MMNFFLAASFSAFVFQDSVAKRVPVTVEVLRDVEVRVSEMPPDGTSYQVRGVLYSSKAFVIHKGDHLVMTRDLGEGECRVALRGVSHDLRSCPWLPGFRDHESDIYRVVKADTAKNLSRAAGTRA